MGRKETTFAPAQLREFVARGIAEGLRTGLVFQTADGPSYAARHVDIEGEQLLNFGSCSYLGLDQRNELRAGAIDAIHRFGTQFSYSRAYLQSPLYPELEDLLSQMTGGYALVTPSTTHAHVSALPVLVEPDDAVVIDKFAHASLHTAVTLFHDNPVTTVPHDDMAALRQKLTEKCAAHARVWYVIDGVYSMSGNYAPFDDLIALQSELPNLHYYIDDAHATSWAGTHGRGLTLERFKDRSRLVVALSLNKAFAAAGGALIFSSDEARRAVQTRGGPMVFGGPVQPPMLGAALASARLHLDPSFDDLQVQLRERIELLRSHAATLGVPIATRDVSPIISVNNGGAKAAFELTRRLRQRGFYTSPAAPPAVPPELSGIRATVTLHNTHDDIRALVQTLAEEMQQMSAKSAAPSPAAQAQL